MEALESETNVQCEVSLLANSKPLHSAINHCILRFTRRYKPRDPCVNRLEENQLTKGVPKHLSKNRNGILLHGSPRCHDDKQNGPNQNGMHLRPKVHGKPYQDSPEQAKHEKMEHASQRAPVDVSFAIMAQAE